MNLVLNHIALTVPEPSRSAHLFRELFEATVVELDPDGRGLAEARAIMGQLTIVLVPGWAPDDRASRLAFGVSSADLERIRRKLTGLGLPFESPRHGSKDRDLCFTDYDGYMYELCAVDPE